MKKLLTLLLILALLLPVFGCDGSVPPETVPSTQPTDPQIAVPTTVPTEPEETTAPPEITVAPTEPEPTKSASDADLYIDEHTAKFLPSEEELAASGFEAWLGTPWTGNVYDFGYIGESGTITVPGGELTIEIPEEWLPHLTIVWTFSYPGYWYLTISSTDLLYAIAANAERIAPEDVDLATALIYTHKAGMLQIYASQEQYPAFSLSSMRQEHCDLGTDGTYVYAAMTMDTLERSNGRHICQDLIDKIGEEAYRELTKDMVITEEMAKEIITIHGLIEE